MASWRVGDGWTPPTRDELLREDLERTTRERDEALRKLRGLEPQGLARHLPPSDDADRDDLVDDPECGAAEER